MRWAGGLAELDAAPGDGAMAPLHRSPADAQTNAAKVLIMDSANVKIADSSQRSALHYAVQSRHGDCRS